ncbi:MAG: DUF11 domain-containing protein [Anaerolineae bacterium]|nr:DUF11 domain-containing protein [Anaerolineae bacterium]
MNPYKRQIIRFYWRGFLLPTGLAIMLLFVFHLGLLPQVKQLPTIVLAEVESNFLARTMTSDCNTDENLVPNCSFENLDPSNPFIPEGWKENTWEDASADLIWYRGLAYRGQRSVFIEKHQGGKSRWLLNPMLDLIAGERYYFSVRIKTEQFTDDSRAYMNLIFWDADEEDVITFFSTERVLTDENWQEFRGEGVAPPGARAYLECILSGIGLVWFDEVYLSNVPKAPILEVALDATPAPVDAGAPLTYTVWFSNVGNAELQPTVVFTLDEHLSVEAVYPLTTSQAGNVLVWDPFDEQLEISASVRLTIATGVTPGLPDGSMLLSEVWVGGEGATPVVAGVTTVAHSRPNVNVEKLAPPTVTAGNRLTYTVVLTNEGNACASNIVVFDTYPDNPNCLCHYSDPETEIPDLDPGETYSFTLDGWVSASCPISTFLNNKVTVRVLGEKQDEDSVSTHVVNDDGGDVYTITLRRKEDVLWTVYPPASPDGGVYYFELQNTGNRAVTNIHLTVDDALRWSDAYTFVVTPTLVQQLDPGTIHAVTVTGIAPPCVVSGTTNTLMLTAAGNPDVTVVATATLEVGRFLAGGIFPGRTYTVIHPLGSRSFTYIKNIKNIGNFTTSFEIEPQDLPSGWSVDWTPDSVTLGPCAFITALEYISFPLVTQGATLRTDLSAEEKDLDSGFDQVEVMEYISATLSPGAPYNVFPGTLLTFTKSVTNEGNVTATFILTYGVETYKDITDGWNISWDPGTLCDLGPKKSATSTATISLSHFLEDGAALTLTTWVTPVAGLSPTSVDVVRVQSPKLALHCQEDLWPVWPYVGHPYSCTMLNIGSRDALSVQLAVSDSLSWSKDAFDISPPAVGTIAPQDVVTVTVTVTAPVSAPGDIINVLTLSAMTPNCATETTASLKVQRYISAQLECPDKPWSVWPYQENVCNCTVHNTGNQMVTDLQVTITDSLRSVSLTVIPTEILQLAPDALPVIVTVTGTVSPTSSVGRMGDLTMSVEIEDPAVIVTDTMPVIVGDYFSMQLECPDTVWEVWPQQGSIRNCALYNTGNQVLTEAQVTLAGSLGLLSMWSITPTRISRLEPDDPVMITITGTASSTVMGGTAGTLTVSVVTEKSAVVVPDTVPIRVGEYVSAQLQVGGMHTVPPDLITKYVTNTGNITATFGLISTPDEEDSDLWHISWITPLRDLAPGSSAVSTGTVLYPLEDGVVMTFTTQVTSTDNVETTSVDIIQVQAPKLDVDCRENLWPVWPYKGQSYKCWVSNIGSRDALSVRLTVSNSLNWPEDVFDVSPHTVITIASQANLAVTLIITAPTWEVGDTINTLTLSVTASNDVTDTTVALAVQRYISVAVEGDLQHSVTPGGQLSFTKRVKNMGNFTATFELISSFSGNDNDEWDITWNPNPVNALGFEKDTTSIAIVSHPSIDDAMITITTMITDLEGQMFSPVIITDVVRVKKCKVYLPFILGCPLPSTPTLKNIDNKDIDGNYKVSWDSVDYATHYVLEEEHEGISRLITITKTFYSFEDMDRVHYKYRVKACNYSQYCNLCSNFSSYKEIEPWCEDEPNNSGGYANGPLLSEQIYCGRPEDDKEDYFWFKPTTGKSIVISLTNYTGCDGWLLLYYKDYLGSEIGSCKIKSDEDQCFITDTGNRPSDRYYVRVYTGGCFNRTPYTLQVNFSSSRKKGSIEGIRIRNNYLY